MPAPPTYIRNPTELEQKLGRRVAYARPPALRGAELMWLTAWGEYTPAAIDDRYQIVRVDNSKATIRCGSTEYPLVSGMVTVASPNVGARVARRHSPYSRVRGLMVSPAVLRSVELGERRSARPRGLSYLVRKEPSLRSSFDLLFASVLDGESSLAQQSALLSCVCAATHALKLFGSESLLPSIPERLKRALDFLNDSFMHDVSLEDLTQAVGADIHPRYLLSTFTREFGVAPHQYLLRLRILRARELLARGKSATSVAREVGFYDAPQLHGHFVRVMGITPGAYARAVR